MSLDFERNIVTPMVTHTPQEYYDNAEFAAKSLACIGVAYCVCMVAGLIFSDENEDPVVVFIIKPLAIFVLASLFFTLTWIAYKTNACGLNVLQEEDL